MKKAFNERVLFEKVEEEVKKSGLDLGGEASNEVFKIKVLDWGTHRDGSPFANETYKIGDTAYLFVTSKAIKIPGGKWLIDRGHILGLD